MLPNNHLNVTVQIGGHTVTHLSRGDTCVASKVTNVKTTAQLSFYRSKSIVTVFKAHTYIPLLM